MRKAKSNFLRKLMGNLNQEVSDYNSSINGAEVITYSRRKFIADTTKGAIGAGLILSLPSFLISCKNEKAEPTSEILDIAILGGGISGLNCANHLLNSNLNFKVYEGSRRLGGRILTHYNDSLGLGIFPEFGGDFIDSTHKDMIDLAKEFKLKFIDLEEEQKAKNLIKDTYYFDNRIIPEDEIITEFNKIAKKIAIDKNSLGENYDTPDAEILDNIALSDYIASLECQTWLKDLLTAAFTSEFGLDCSEQSSLNLLDMVDSDTSAGFRPFGDSDEKFRIQGGNSKIIEGLTNKIGDKRLERNHEVSEISEDDQGTYHIKFTNDKIVSAKRIVCTIPFTILRKIKLNLKNMSNGKKMCIEELGYGMNTKLVLGYDGVPWSEKPNSAMGYLFHKDIVNGWDSSYNKTPDNDRGAYVAYFGGTFSQNLDKESFKNKMAPPTHSWKTELPESRISSLIGELDKAFKGSKDRFLGKHVFVNWIDYPYAKGSYSCYKKGQWTTISGLEMQPVGNFYFAGEHCSEAFQGFMNGGAETGRRVAEELLQLSSETKVASTTVG
ncbi:FAD-dependent oxidoreductase [Aequorivita sp. H23M31]|uniref:FAD-dependent oxidoreductase n=1 Tax=Aequorivita ciconiae TaxID=2494375 RepID=A0A410FZN9_9FLAO|nr:NAD(P)/FAD-dependent oxidoreductase [Aequorivita sp. H23M31]QAA80469.1 FAD-dependent oxidoreductase [Aequorivita sp. H23M31]